MKRLRKATWETQVCNAGALLVFGGMIIEFGYHGHFIMGIVAASLWFTGLAVMLSGIVLYFVNASKKRQRRRMSDDTNTGVDNDDL